MKYIAECRYGTKRNGRNEYMCYFNDSFTPNGVLLDNAYKFNSVEEAQKVVSDWCDNYRSKTICHSGKGWDLANKNRWKYIEVEDDEFLIDCTCSWDTERHFCKGLRG